MLTLHTTVERTGILKLTSTIIFVCMYSACTGVYTCHVIYVEVWKVSFLVFTFLYVWKRNPGTESWDWVIWLFGWRNFSTRDVQCDMAMPMPTIQFTQDLLYSDFLLLLMTLHHNTVVKYYFSWVKMCYICLCCICLSLYRYVTFVSPCLPQASDWSYKELTGQ